MFTKSEQDPSELDKAIAAAYKRMHDSDTPLKYDTALDQVIKLNEIKAKQAPDRISKDTLALIAANLTGILLIITHEHTHVIATKAMQHVLKPK